MSKTNNPLPKENEWEIIRSLWRRLRPWQRFNLLLRACLAYLGTLRPAQLIWPAVCGQIVVFLISMQHAIEKAFFIMAIGNLIVVALAISPTLFRPPAPARTPIRAHWV